MAGQRTPTKQELQDRRKRVRRWRAQGMTTADMLVALGWSDTAANRRRLQRDLEAIREEGVRRVMEAPQVEAEDVARHLERMEARLDLLQDQLGRFTVPGTSEHAGLAREVRELEALILETKRKLGLHLEAPKRLTLHADDELAGKDADELLELIAAQRKKAAELDELLTPPEGED